MYIAKFEKQFFWDNWVIIPKWIEMVIEELKR